MLLWCHHDDAIQCNMMSATEKMVCCVVQIDAYMRGKLRADASRHLKDAVPRHFGAAFDNDGKVDKVKADVLIPSMPRSFY